MIFALVALSLTQAPAQTDAAAPALVPSGAPGVTIDAMREAMHTYVRGERRSILPFGIAAATSLIGGALLLDSKDPLTLAAGSVALGFGILELAAGLFFGIRNEQPKLDALLDENPAAFKREEEAKVTRISTRFQPILLGFEGALVAAGGLMAGLGARQQQPSIEGVGIALAIEGLVFFLIDWAVLDRADDYLAVLKHFR